MKKKFNTTGLCFSTLHYMADTSKQLRQTVDMVEEGEYFVINRPRQYGKTTTLYALADSLAATGEYIVFNMSFEGVGKLIFENENAFSKGFVSLLGEMVEESAQTYKNWYDETAKEVHDLKTLSNLISKFANKADKKLVLLIDEVDQSSNNEIFILFLAMLRNKYLQRIRHKTFHSVVLAGLHDVKSLKLKLRPDAEQKYNSPWNIAADYKVDMNLQATAIKPMLDEYSKDKGVTMDTKAISEILFYHTSGYPFLVSKLCKTIDEDILPNKIEKTWTFADIEQAVRLLLKEKNTNFDSLIKNLENNNDLYNFVYRIIIEGDIVYFNADDPLIDLGILHGIFVDNGQIKIHNRLYEQRLYNYMTSKTEIRLKSNHNYGGHFALDDGNLDMPAVLLKFQQFMKEEYHEKDKSFLEQQGRLVFLSFLSPILNGKGHSFKEVQTSEEKRLDIVVSYNKYKYIIELKRWYGENYHQKGIKQLDDYLEIHGLKQGFLLIFQYNKIKLHKTEWIEYNGKRIFAVWV